MAAKYQKTIGEAIIRKVPAQNFMAEHCQEDAEMKDSPNAFGDAPHKATRIARRKLPVSSRKAKEDVAEKQVSFIIATRDNNKPDPYGQNSITNAPLPWPAVAEAYNKVFRIGQKPVGSAAMEKRARQHREQWMEARPDYPRNIVYAKKAAAFKAQVSREVGAKSAPRVVGTARKAYVQGQNIAVRSNAESDVLTKPARPGVERLTRVAGWIPPDAVRNQDMYGSLERVITASTPDEDETTTIEVSDVRENQASTIRVRTRDIIKTSAVIAQQWETATDITATLQASSGACVERYIMCISPVQLPALAEVGIQRKRKRDDIAVNTAERPVWDFVALVDLYNVATVLQDSHVRQLVMNRWLEMQSQDSELELDLQALNSLFAATESRDPARAFWASALHSAGLAEEVIRTGVVHASLVAMLEDMMIGCMTSLAHG